MTPIDHLRIFELRRMGMDNANIAHFLKLNEFEVSKLGDAGSFVIAMPERDEDWRAMLEPVWASIGKECPSWGAIRRDAEAILAARAMPALTLMAAE
jgi:hypothetical protein